MPCSLHDGQIWVGDQAIGPHPSLPDGPAAALYIRSHDIEIVPAAQGTGLPGVITRVTLTGGSANVAVRLAAGADIEIELPRWTLESLALVNGQTVRLTPRRFSVFGAAALRSSGRGA